MKKSLQYILPVALTVVLVWLLFRKVDFKQTMEIIHHGVAYQWILLGMAISVFSHIFRAMRWKLQFDALGVRIGLMDLTCSIFGCYALNLLVPRLGELWRCTFVSRRAKAPFTTVVGSMVADRLSDTLMVLFLLLLTFVLAASALASFLAKYPVGAEVLHLLESIWLWIALASSFFIVWLAFHTFRDSKWVLRLKRWSAEVWKGFVVVVNMPSRLKFLLLTLAIWSCYFTQLYVAMFAFDFTRDLCGRPELAFGLLPCLVAFVFSSIGMAIPSNGGLGPWNIAVMFGLAIYGVAEVEGAAFSILVWSAQTVMLVVLGVFAAIRITMSAGKGNIN